MERHTFDRFWKKSFSKRLESTLVICAEHQENIDFDALRDILYDEYEELKEDFKSKYFIEQIDRHKIAALFCIAVLRKPLLKVNSNSKHVPNFYKLQNEYFALSCALSIIMSFVTTETKDHSSVEEAKEIAKRGIKIPNKIYETPLHVCTPKPLPIKYQSRFYVMLHQARKSGTLDVLKLSNIFFLLEAYSDLAYRIDTV